MPSEEKLVKGMRRRRTSLVILATLVIGLGGIYALEHSSSKKLKTELDKGGDPEHVLLARLAYVQTAKFFYGGLFGLSVALFFVELSGRNRKKLLIAMWDKIQQLEERMRLIAASQSDTVHCEDQKKFPAENPKEI